MHTEQDRHDGAGERTYDFGPLTLRQAEDLADFSAKRNEERLFAVVGRSVVTKIIYFIGAGITALAVWVAGWIHLSPPK